MKTVNKRAQAAREQMHRLAMRQTGRYSMGKLEQYRKEYEAAQKELTKAEALEGFS